MRTHLPWRSAKPQDRPPAPAQADGHELDPGNWSFSLAQSLKLRFSSNSSFILLSRPDARARPRTRGWRGCPPRSVLDNPTGYLHGSCQRTTIRECRTRRSLGRGRKVVRRVCPAPSDDLLVIHRRAPRSGSASLPKVWLMVTCAASFSVGFAFASESRASSEEAVFIAAFDAAAPVAGAQHATQQEARKLLEEAREYSAVRGGAAYAISPTRRPVSRRASPDAARDRLSTAGFRGQEPIGGRSIQLSRKCDGCR